jgi:cytosine/adenosine deaminase-related metal-dependent hydrolase
VHTHLSENKDEIAWVKDLFPAQKVILMSIIIMA